MTKDKLVAEMDKAVETIGYVNAWVQPIRARVMMQTTGIQTPVGIKVKGPDLAVIEDLSQQIERTAPRLSRDQVRHRRAHFGRLLRRRAERPRAHGRAWCHRRRGDGDRALRHRRRQHRRDQAGGQHHRSS